MPSNFLRRSVKAMISKAIKWRPSISAEESETTETLRQGFGGRFLRWQTMAFFVTAALD